MGWQTSMLFIEINCPDDILGLLHDLGVLEDSQIDEELSFVAPSSSTDFDEVYVGSVEGWTIVCGMPVMLAGGQQEYSRNAKVVEMTLSGASSTYHYAVYSDGKEQRMFTEQEGKIIESRGAPLPQEADMDAFPYSSHTLTRQPSPVAVDEGFKQLVNRDKGSPIVLSIQGDKMNPTPLSLLHNKPGRRNPLI